MAQSPLLHFTIIETEAQQKRRRELLRQINSLWVDRKTLPISKLEKILAILLGTF